MQDILSQSFTLLLVGMLTVFTILALLVASGNLLVILTNKLDLDDSGNSMLENFESKDSGISSSHKKIIEEAVKKISGGKSMVSEIKKLD